MSPHSLATIHAYGIAVWLIYIGFALFTYIRLFIQFTIPILRMEWILTVLSLFVNLCLSIIWPVYWAFLRDGMENDRREQ